MIVPIYTYGHPVLRKKAIETDLNDTQLTSLISDLFDTMYHAQGVGIAAPQIGKSIRIFVIDSAPFAETDPAAEIYKGAFINPVLLDRRGEDYTFNEGCLSLPDIHEDVVRKSVIEIEFTDEKGVRQHKVFDGYVARIIQHEYDHLDGQVFTDRVSSLKKMLLKKKLNDIANGKVSTKYKIKNK